MNESATPVPPIPDSSKANRSAMLIVFLVIFIDLLGFGIVLPLLPVISRDYVGEALQLAPGEYEKNRQVGLIVGLLMSSFSLMQFLFSPSWGKLSDRVGRRPVLLIGLCGSVVFYALFGYAASLPRESATLALVLFFVARIGAGLAGATISTAQAVIADCTPPDKRKHGMALIGIAFGIGFTFGPLLGFLALKFFPDHNQAIGYTASVLSLLALILGFVRMPETRNFATGVQERKIVNVSGLRYVLGSAAIGPVILVFFLASLGFAGFEVTLAVLLKQIMRVQESDINQLFLFFAYVGFVLMLTQGYFYRKLAKRMSEIRLMTIGIVAMGLGVCSLGLVTVLSADAEPSAGLIACLFAALTSSVVGFAFLTPSAQALISRRTAADRQGEILGVNQSASAMARILGPVIFLPLFFQWHVLPYLVGGGLLLLMLPLLPTIRKAAPDAPQ